MTSDGEQRPQGTGERKHPIVGRVIAAAVTGLMLYVLLPTLVRVFDAWPRLAHLSPAWIIGAALLEPASFACNVGLQRLVLRTKGWYAPTTAWLVGNAITNVLPAGDAAGAAVQYEILATAGIDTDAAKGGLAAASLLGLGGLLALPLISLPVILTGAPVRPELLRAGLLGLLCLAFFLVFGFVVLRYDWPLHLVGRLLGWILRHLPGDHQAVGVTDRLLKQRDEIRAVLGKQWRVATMLTAGRLGFDFFCLLCTVRATGANPNPGLVLLAYTAAQVIALFPITPGGLGIVEASLTGLLVLAGVTGGQAVLATLSYRLLSYWLPIVAGAVAYVLVRRRYGPISIHRTRHRTWPGGGGPSTYGDRPTTSNGHESPN